MTKVKIFGPTGDPDAKADPKPVTMVPWEEVKNKENTQGPHHNGPQQSISQTYSFTDQNAVIRTFSTHYSSLPSLTLYLVDDSQDVFGERDELNMTTPRRGTPSGLRQRTSPAQTPAPISMPSAVTMPAPSRPSGLEEFEMATPRVDTFAHQS